MKAIGQSRKPFTVFSNAHFLPEILLMRASSAFLVFAAWSITDPIASFDQSVLRNNSLLKSLVVRAPVLL
jgi:hypothetical protein